MSASQEILVKINDEAVVLGEGQSVVLAAANAYLASEGTLPMPVPPVLVENFNLSSVPQAS